MTDLLIAFIKLLLIAFLYVLHTELSFGRSIALSYITVAMLLFISTVIRDFSLFNKVLLCFAAVLLIAAYKRGRMDQDHIKDALRRFLRPGMVIFTVLFFYLYSVDRHLSLSMIDDFLRWGGMVRDCVNNNVLYSRDLPVMIPPGKYPPFTTLISVFFNKSMRGYNESWSLLAIGTFCISLMMPVTEKLEWKKQHILQIVLYPVLIIAALLCVQMNAHMQYPAFVFNSTYVDWVMSLMTAYGLYQVVIYSGTPGNHLALGLLLTGLILVDRVSIAFDLLIIGAWFLRILMMKENNDKTLGCIAVSVFLPLCVYGGWRFYVSSYSSSTIAVKASFDIAINAGGQNNNAALLTTSPVRISYSVNNDDTEESPFDFSNYQKDTRDNFIKALATEPVMTRPISLNYYATVALLTAALAGLGKLRKSRTLTAVSIIFLLGSAAYAAAMLYGYMYNLNEYEATGLAAYGRYMETYTYSGLALLFLLLLDELKTTQTAAAAVLACLCVEPQSISTITPKFEDELYRPIDRAMIEYYIGSVYQGESLVVVNQTDMAYRQFIKYLFGVYGDNVYYFQGNEYNRYGHFHDFIWNLDNRDLMLIADYDDYFYENLWSQVTDEPLQYSCIYRIIKKETGYDFEPVYQWYSPQWE